MNQRTLSLCGIIAPLLFGIWSIKTGIFPGLGTHSFVTIGLLAASTFILIRVTGGPLMGLVERIAGLVGLQWTFILALRMFFRKENRQGFTGGGAG